MNRNNKYSPVGSTTITGSDAVETLTLPEGGNVGSIFLSVEGGSCRFWFDGSTPSVSSGHLIGDLDEKWMDDINFSDFRLYVPLGVKVYISFFC